MPLSALNAALALAGLALPILGSISDQTVAGAIAMGTHGSSVRHGAIHSVVVGLALVDGRGRLLRAGEGGDEGEEGPENLLDAARCALGALGVVVRVTLAAVPAFDLASAAHEVPLAEACTDLLARAASAEYFRLWWFPHTGMALDWRAERRSPSPPPPPPSLVDRVRAWLVDSLFGFHLLQAALAVSLLLPNLVPAIARFWRAALHGAPVDEPARSLAPSPAGFNFDCLFRQHVSEWALPAEAAPAALAALEAELKRTGLLAHFPVEVRFAAEDGAWLSPAVGRATAWIGIISYRPYGIDAPYRDYFEAYERLMRELGGRPHWAKEFALAGDVDFAAMYPRWHDFKALRSELDPEGVFANEWLRHTLGLGMGPERARQATANTREVAADSLVQ